MTAGEIQAAVERAEAERSELQGLDPGGMPPARIFRMLPRAAEEYRRQITLELGGEPRGDAESSSDR